MKNPLRRNNNNKRDKDSNEEGKRWDKRLQFTSGTFFHFAFASVLVSLALRHSPGKSVKSLIRTANSFNFPLPRPITMPNQVGFSRHLSLSVRGRAEGRNEWFSHDRKKSAEAKVPRAGKWIFDTSDGTRALFSNCRFPILLFAFKSSSLQHWKARNCWAKTRMAAWKNGMIMSRAYKIFYFARWASEWMPFPREKKVPVMKSRKRNNVFSLIIHSKPSDKSFLSSSFTFGYIFSKARNETSKNFSRLRMKSLHEKYIFSPG